MSLPIRAFYHCWTPGKWQTPYAEFKRALVDSAFPADRVTLNFSTATSEAETINLVREYALANDGVVLYAHSKGSFQVEPFRDRWRRSMTARVVERWRENLTLLQDGFDSTATYHGMVDAVGCHWLTEENSPGMFGPMTIPAPGSGFFGGNFWMARCDYLRTLPECEAEPRWKAESWIGIGRPRVVDLLPGWPHDNRWPELCG